MRIGVIGAGRIGGNVARRLAGAGHEIKLSFSRDPGRLAALSEELGDRTSFGTPAGARYTKAFNTLTAAFQEESAGRAGSARVVQWLCGDDEDAKAVVAGLIEEAGYAPVDLGGTAGCAVMEAPRRAGAVYGEEYRPVEAAGVLAAVRDGEPIPPRRCTDPPRPAGLGRVEVAVEHRTGVESQPRPVKSAGGP